MLFLQLIPLPNVDASVMDDPNSRAVVRVAGTVDSVNSENFSFRLDVQQYVAADTTGTLPIQAQIPISCKWKDRSKALPKRRSIVSFTGFLVDITRGPSNIQLFVDVPQHLDFLTLGLSTPATPTSCE